MIEAGPKDEKPPKSLSSIESDNGPETSSSNKVTIGPEMLQRIYELVASSQNEIHNSRNEIRGLKRSSTNSRQPITQRLTAELQNLTQLLKELRNGAALAGSAQTSPQASYAQLARTPRRVSRATVARLPR
ncbi:hypothetical protein PG988_000309 [Apiospora saccharicola]